MHLSYYPGYKGIIPATAAIFQLLELLFLLVELLLHILSSNFVVKRLKNDAFCNNSCIYLNVGPIDLNFKGVWDILGILGSTGEELFPENLLFFWKSVDIQSGCFNFRLNFAWTNLKMFDLVRRHPWLIYILCPTRPESILSGRYRQYV